MAETRVTRKLAAIVAADMVGYSRLMGADEEGTIARQKAHRADLIDPKFAEHNGRIVKTTGDGLLVEFGSAVDAVLCAVEVQRAMTEREANEPAERRIAYRVGINIGDILIDGDDILGDGVNIAARLETLADPGGIVIARNVFNQIKNKTELGFEDLGEQNVKNIAEPIGVYRVLLDPEMAGVVKPAPETPVLDLPDRPSIAVLPFEDLSAKHDQEYLADGIVDDLITALSRYRWFFVIARNSSFTYRGKAVDVKQVAWELGVRFVLEGSVRTAGNRLRIVAQLIDGTTGRHIWAERYDRVLDDIFAVQDEITETIVGTVEPELGGMERELAQRNPPETLNAWQCYHRGMAHLYRFTEDDLNEAQKLLQRAIDIDPSFAQAYAGLAWSHALWNFFPSNDAPSERLAEGLLVAERAVALDDKDAFARFALGRNLIVHGKLDEAISQLHIAIELNPSLAYAHQGLGIALQWSGRSADAILELDQAIRLSPRDPVLFGFLNFKSIAHYHLEEYETSVEWAKKSIQERSTHFWSYGILAAALAQLGRSEEATAAVEEAMRRQPKLSLDLARGVFPRLRTELQQHFLDGLRKAGLPEN